jgi:hypothetical protein
MTLFSYVTRLDHGFAPNPFHGICTLATCKSEIRMKAAEGDWVLGTGSAKRGYGGRAVFLMQVGKIITYDQYWRDPRFLSKQPVLNGSFKLRFGDNIYHRETPGSGPWIQADSRHSLHGAEVNAFNLKRDTRRTDCVLLAENFVYWGELAPTLPKHLTQFRISRPGCEYRYSEGEINKFLQWALALNQRGRVGDPIEWKYARWW